MGNLSRNFDREEFACKCGCGLDNISPALIEVLQSMRDYIEVPMRISSGLRCKDWNASVGGQINSSHLDGLAADILVGGSMQRHLILKGALLHFDRVGVGKDFIHVDIDDEKARPVAWVY